MALENEPEFIALCKFLEKFDKDSVRRVFEKMSKQLKLVYCESTNRMMIIHAECAEEFEEWDEVGDPAKTMSGQSM